MVPKHVNGVPECPLCTLKLSQAHQDLAEWFKTKVKPLHPDCHISWSWRGKEDQEQAFTDGKSKLHFPLSAHNKEDDQNNPCAMALDLFELDFNSIARWAWAYFRTIADEATAAGDPIVWGGTWTHLSDSDHYQLK